MSTQENGIPANVSSPSAIAIQSSTNANPIVLTTSASHGLTTGDQVDIDGHLVNTDANGVQLVVTVLSNTTFSIPVAGNGVGAATGFVRPLTAGSTFAIPSDGVDLENAASVNVPFNALADRTAFSISRGGVYETDYLVTDYQANQPLTTSLTSAGYSQMGSLVTGIVVAQNDIVEFIWAGNIQVAIVTGAPGSLVHYALRLQYAYYAFGGSPVQTTMLGTDALWQPGVAPSATTFITPATLVGRLGGPNSANVLSGTLPGNNTMGLLDVYLWGQCTNADGTHTATLSIPSPGSILTRRHWRPTGLLR